MKIFIALIFSSLLFALEIKFSGNDNISDGELYDAIGVYNPYFFEIFSDKPNLKQDAVAQSVSAIENFYKSNGFYKSKVTYTLKDNTVIFNIVENDPIVVKDIKTNSILDIEKSIKLSLEDRFNETLFNDSKQQIKKKYANAGYCNSELNSKAYIDIETNSAFLIFDITPLQKCHFGKITIESTPNIDSDILRGLIYFDEGDEYSLDAIKQSYESLYSKDIITKVLINDNDRDGSTVPVHISVEEGDKPIHFSAGVGYNSDEGGVAQLGLKHRNIFGDLKTLSFDSRYSKIKQDLSATLTHPFKSKSTLAAEIGYTNEIFDGYKTQSIYEKISASYFYKPISYMAGVLFDRIKTYDSKDTNIFENSTLFIPSPIFEANIDTRDNPLEPTRGYTLNAKLSGSAYIKNISDSSYFKSTLSGSYIFSISDHIFALKSKWGTLRRYGGDLPSSYRFYAGGMGSNRAYTYRNLGPKSSSGDAIGYDSVVEGSVEYRFPIYNNFRGVVFSDITYASEHFMPDFSNDGYLAVGLGLRYQTPIGPIALDFGFRPSDISINAIHFRIGELF